MAQDTRDPLVRAQELAPVGRPSLSDGRSGSALECCVTIEFETAGLPSSVVKMDRLVQVMGDRLQMRLDKDTAGFARDMEDFKSISVSEFDERVPVPIGFSNGAFRVDKAGKTRTVLIDFVHFVGRGDTIRTSVFGDGEDAELALSKAYECIWEAAGERRQWADGIRSVFAKGYKTASHEVLDCSHEHLFSSGINHFLKLAAEPDGLCSNVGVRPMNAATGQAEAVQAHVAVRFRQLRFLVTVIDLASGRTWESTLELAPRTRSTYAKGTYVVTSECPFREHEKLVAALRHALEAEPAALGGGKI